MKASPHHNIDLDRERQALTRAGRLHTLHWVVVIGSMVVTLIAWQFSKQQIQDRVHSRFVREADQVVSLVSERMRKYEDGLWGGVAAIQANGGDIDYLDWLTFANSLRIDVKYPGINGIGVIHHVRPSQMDEYLQHQQADRPDYYLYPQHDLNDYWPITYIEPYDNNAQAVGLDMAHETNRYTAALKARDTGTAQITGPIVLVQDQEKTPGFLFFAPFYKGGTYADIERRRQNIVGLVYAPFVVHKLMEGTLERSKRHVGISIADSQEGVYDEHQPGHNDFDPDPLFTKQYAVNLYGRTWEFDIWSTKAFRAASASSQPTLILAGGMAMDALLLMLFLLLSRSSRRAIAFADRATEQLKSRSHALELLNEELERFAYVTSHDLKTPLRGINDLTEYLHEDLKPYLTSPQANPDVQHNLKRLESQVLRMDNLIKGILEYASTGNTAPDIERTDLSAIANNIAQDLALPPGTLHIPEQLPVFQTDATLLEQVLSNLISNAAKYHHDLPNAHITLTAELEGKFCKILVTDNGPGIDAKYHERIFEPFQTLQSKDQIESTGIGLSIVKKIVEKLGGQVALKSEPGTGSTFTVKWPITLQQTQAA